MRASVALLLGVLASGCVTFYQPQVSLQRPVIVDPEVANFEGLRLLIRCVPGEYVEDEDAEQLCRKLRPVFANQGAIVEVEVPTEKGSARIEEPGAPRPDLIIDLTARLLHSENSVLLWLISIGTATLVPAITDYTFAQDVSIRDKSGFLLASDTLQGRFVRYFGFGMFAVNGIVDLIARARGQRLSGSNPKEDFSKDFYGQLSQLAFHAQMRARVLRSFEGEPATATAAGPTAPPPAIPAPVAAPRALTPEPSVSPPSKSRPAAAPSWTSPEAAQPPRTPLGAPSSPPPPPPSAPPPPPK